MAIHAPGIRVPQPSEDLTKLQVDIIQAPTGGVDARAPVGMMPPDVSLYTYNMMPAEYGMLLREGFTQWCRNIGSGSENSVRTLISSYGLDPTNVDNRLFACCQAGIYNVSEFDSTALEIAFPDNGEGAGHGVFCHYIDESINDWIFYADALNGLYEYDGVLDTWAVSTRVTGPVTTDIVFVMVHKKRIWLVEEGASSAWYLDVAAIGGAATAFHFGAKFLHGGRIAGIFNWTVDGGIGVDDLFVVISTAGDVLVYRGDSPSAAETWEIVGTYYVGEIPIGRRFVGSYAGDLYILSSFGLTAMSDLLKGVDTADKASKSLAYKVARPLRAAMVDRLEEYGWEPIFLPTNGHLVVNTLVRDPVDKWNSLQYVMNLSTEAWGFWRGVPALSLASYVGYVLFGDDDGNVWVMYEHTDRGTIAQNKTDAVPIEFSMVSSTQHYGQPGLFKQVQMVRPDFWTAALPDYTLQVKYDYDYQEADYSLPPPPTVNDPTPPTGASKLGGTAGMGRTVTVSMKGSATGECRLVSWDVMWKAGGPV